MARKIFTDEQREMLQQNPYVESVEPAKIIYTEEFKVYYVKNYLEGKKPTEIFVSAGFNPSVLGNKRIERASARWRKLYAAGQLTINNEEKKEQIDIENKPEKKRRGRPRKNPIVVEEVKTKDNIIAKEKTEYTPKKRRGRPRKNPEVETTKVQEVKKPRKRINKIAIMAQSLNIADNAKEEQKIEAKPAKRRGRPRKNPVATTSTVTEKVSKIIVQPEKTIQVIPQVISKEQEIEINERPITALVKAINRLTKQVDSLKRLVAGKKKINY